MLTFEVTFHVVDVMFYFRRARRITRQFFCAHKVLRQRRYYMPVSMYRFDIQTNHMRTVDIQTNHMRTVDSYGTSATECERCQKTMQETRRRQVYIWDLPKTGYLASLKYRAANGDEIVPVGGGYGIEY